MGVSDPGGRRPGRGPEDRPVGAPVGAKVLVVDDEEPILGMVCEVLADAGYEVLRARNGIEALDQIKRARPSLILLDMRMPVMDGWRFAAALSREQVAIPVVVMTAAEDARRWAAEIGAEGYLAKPFDLDHLLDVVRRHAEPPRSN